MKSLYSAGQVGNYFLQTGSNAAISAIKLGTAGMNPVLLMGTGLCVGGYLLKLKLRAKKQELYAEIDLQSNNLCKERTELHEKIDLQRTNLFKERIELHEKIDLQRTNLFKERIELHEKIGLERTKMWDDLALDRAKMFDDLELSRKELQALQADLDSKKQEAETKIFEERLDIAREKNKLIEGQNAFKMMRTALDESYAENYALRAEKQLCLEVAKKSAEGFFHQLEISKQLQSDLMPQQDSPQENQTEPTCLGLTNEEEFDLAAVSNIVNSLALKDCCI